MKSMIDQLATAPVCGYAAGGTPAVEPTALAALALLGAGRRTEALPALDWLVETQAPDGSLGVDRQRARPAWPTGWAVLGWQQFDGNSDAGRYATQVRRAIEWTLSISGQPITQDKSGPRVFGHDTMLRGWPWVETTHSWIEPTAIHVLSLKATGHSSHERCREAVRLLFDRVLPTGGWNYGNTTVLGNALRPHVQPTGLALAALADEPDATQRLAPSIAYLDRELSPRTATASLCYAVVGLTLSSRRPPDADAWLATAAQRAAGRDASPYKLALLALAMSPLALWEMGRS